MCSLVLQNITRRKIRKRKCFPHLTCTCFFTVISFLFKTTVWDVHTSLCTVQAIALSPYVWMGYSVINKHYLCWGKPKSNMTLPELCGPFGRKLSLVWRPSLSVYAKKIHPCHSKSFQFNRSTWRLLMRALRPPLQPGCTSHHFR